MSNNSTQKINQLYLSFALGERRFLTELSLVREVRQMKGFTAVPQSAQELLGIVNLRGDVIPVFDLVSVLDKSVESKSADSSLCLIVEAHERICALVVHSVADVVRIDDDKILPIPASSMSQNANFYKGIVQLDSEYMIVLDLTAVLQILQPQEQLVPSL